MRKSRSLVLLLCGSFGQKFIPLPPNHSALCIPLPQGPFKWYISIFTGVLNTKFFSSATVFSLEKDEISHCALGFGKTPFSTSKETDRSSVELGESDTLPIVVGVGTQDGITGFNENEMEGGDDLSSLLVESIDGDVSLGAEEIREGVADVPEVNIEQLGRVKSILQSTSPQKIESSMESFEELLLTEEFVVRVFQDAVVSRKNLVIFFRWAIRKTAAVRSSRALHLLMLSFSASDEIHKMEAYMLWDLMKEFVKTQGIVTTDMLNQLLSIFWKLEKAKACLEVFNNFDDFGCAPDGNTYYFTIEALGKKSFLIDTAWSVCEKMLNSGSLPDVEKIGKIVTLFCKVKKAKEAHLVYLLAKEKNILPRRDAANFLIGGLCRNDEYVCLALELLEDYMKKSLKYEKKTFSLVVQSLTRIKDAKAAKSLLLRMVDSGPPLGKSAFNFVITGLCKEGEVEDAIALTKLMESRGLMPDVYTYSVIMSGFAKAGLMDEAFEIYCQAKKRHRILAPVTYHILIRGYCRIEEYEKALECLKDMKEHGVQPNSDEYSKLIKTLCLKALDWRTAEELSVEMRASGLRLKGATQSLIAAVKKLEEEEISADESTIDS